MTATAIETNQQIVLSVRIKGDAGPQTGDVVLGGAYFGDFDNTQTYNANEIVVYNGALYRATKNMNAGEFTLANWEPLTDVIARLPDFEPYRGYKKDEIVLVGENLYRAKNDFTAGATFDPTNWLGIDTVDVCIRDFAAHSLYDKDETIVYNNKLYRAVANFKSGSTWSQKDWELINDLVVEDFQGNHNYNKGNIIAVAGSLYRATKTFTSATNFIASDWEKIGNVSIGGFTSGAQYIKGSLIVQDSKLYIAKNNFTAGASFDVNDWDMISDVTVEDYQNQTTYGKNHLVFYNGILYRARTSFISGTSFNVTDWEQIDPVIVSDFATNTYYFKGQLIVEDGSIYRAVKAFTSDSYFDPTDWEQLGVNTLQTVYDNSTNHFTKPAEVRPTDVTFEEQLCAFGSDSHVKSFTDNQSGRETIINGVVLDQTTSVLATAQRTAENYETGDFTATNRDAYTKIGIEQKGSDPYTKLELVDNKQEYFKLQVKKGDCKVEMSPEVQDAFTGIISTMSDTVRGIAKTDGKTTRIGSNDDINAYPIIGSFAANTKYFQGELIKSPEGLLYIAKADFTSTSVFDSNDWEIVQLTPDGTSIRVSSSNVLSAYPVIYNWDANTSYKEGELVYYAGSLWKAKSSFVSGTTFNHTKWSPTRTVIREYNSGSLYLKGEFVTYSGNIYYALQDIPSAPINFNPAQWHGFAPEANAIKYNHTGNSVVKANDVQTAISELDNRVSNTSIKKILLNFCYPVGTIYESTKNVSPATFMGGTWRHYGSGRVLVGVNGDDTDFNTVKKTGGAKTHTLTTAQLPSHQHSLSIGYGVPEGATHAWPMRMTSGGSEWTSIEYNVKYSGATAAWINNTQNTGGGNAHNNLQPYITVYRWERTA